RHPYESRYETAQVSAATTTGLVLALASAVLINLAYLREHDAAADLPVLSMRRPLQSARLLLGDRSWLLGFAMESGGFLRYGAAVAYGVAGGLFFSIGDIATKVATQGGVRAVFAVLLLLGYGLGTALLQIGYQAGAALTVAGLATLVTNALPIAAGTVILDEPVPTGWHGVIRVFAFAAVVTGAVLLARLQPGRTRTPGSGQPAGA